MSQPLVVFRCDAGDAHGTGHVRRCLSLAAVFRDAGWSCAFATVKETMDVVPELSAGEHGVVFMDGDMPAANQAADIAAAWPHGIDVLVTDHYDLDAGFERACRSHAHCLVALDDLANRPREADVLFDSAFGRCRADYRELVTPTCQVCTGSEYALLGSAYERLRGTSLARRQNGVEIKSVVISLGGVDPGSVLEKSLDGLALAQFDGHVCVILGGTVAYTDRLCRRRHDSFRLDVAVAVADMAERLVDADLVIGAGGGSSWERCALGVPTLLIVTAHNQDYIADALRSEGAVRCLGWHETLTARQLATAFSALRDSPGLLCEISARAARLCDGKGAARSFEQIASTAGAMP